MNRTSTLQVARRSRRWAQRPAVLAALALSMSMSMAAGCDAPDTSAPEPAPASSASSPPAEVTQTVTLALEAVEDSAADGPAVALRFERKPNLSGPRAVEAFVYHSPSLRYVSADPGQAAVDAGKQVVVQSPEPGLLRVMVFASTNLNTLDSGPLARLRFERAAAGEAVVDFISDKVKLAPVDAARGMTLSEPLVLGGR